MDKIIMMANLLTLILMFGGFGFLVFTSWKSMRILEAILKRIDTPKNNI